MYQLIVTILGIIGVIFIIGVYLYFGIIFIITTIRAWKEVKLEERDVDLKNK